MFIPIEINSDDLLSQYSMSKSEVEDVIDFAIKSIAAKFYERWVEEAQLSLHSTRSRYIQNLHLLDEGRLTGTILLDYTKDPLIQMIEEGASAFDMKEGFEKSDKVKHNKSGGWYLTIPFKMGAPNTIGDALGSVTNLPQAVYNVLKKKETSPITGKSEGLKNSEIPEQYRAPKTRAKIEIPKSQAFEEYKHKSSIYKGAFKQKDITTGQTSYGSFRRVGENSDKNAFIHPGMEEANLAQKALDRLDQSMEIELTRAVNSALQNFGFES